MHRASITRQAKSHSATVSHEKNLHNTKFVAGLHAVSSLKLKRFISSWQPNALWLNLDLNSLQKSLSRLFNTMAYAPLIIARIIKHTIAGTTKRHDLWMNLNAGKERNCSNTKSLITNEGAVGHLRSWHLFAAVAADKNEHNPNDGDNCYEYWHEDEVTTCVRISPQCIIIVDYIYDLSGKDTKISIENQTFFTPRVTTHNFWRNLHLLNPNIASLRSLSLSVRLSFGIWMARCSGTRRALRMSQNHWFYSLPRFDTMH